MFRFSLFGVPVEIHPWFWITSAILGGITRASTSEALLAVMVFMVISAFSILVHEFGHALVGRRLGGGQASILLYSMGGLAYSHGGKFTRSGHFWRIAAGPGAGFALAFLTVAGLCVLLGPVGGLQVTGRLLFGIKRIAYTEEAFTFLSDYPQRVEIVYDLLWINFWWSAVNLLPVLPLDGGRIVDLFLKPQRRVYQLGMVAGILTSLASLFFLRSIYVPMLFGYFAYQNYQAWQSSRWS
ncbi:MAG TPA: site-2 protease family protein [Luteolibacter sp.]